MRSSRSDLLQVEVDWTKLHKKQRSVLRWRPKRPPDGSAPVSTLAVLGGLGSGKTTVAIKVAALHCLRNGWREEYGEEEPKFIVMRPTLRGIIDDMIPRYRKELPRDLVRRTWKAPFPRWELHNGTHIIFMSGDSDAWSGWDLIGWHIDEVDLPVFDDPNRYTDMQLRLRGPSSEFLFLVSGKASLGFVRETFKIDHLSDEDRFNRETWLFGTDDNPFLSPELRRQALRGTPSHYQRALLKGGWLPTAGSLFPMFSEDRHIVPDSRMDPRATCHVGIDAGVSSAAVIGQELTVQLKDKSTDSGALIVADLVRHGSSLKDLCEAVRATPFNDRLYPNRSKILVDPTIRDEEKRAIQSVFPGYHVIRRDRRDDLYAVEPGLRTIQAGLLDAADDTRIFICESVKRTGKRGLYEGLLKAKENERTGSISTTYKFHAVDAAKYLLSFMLSTPPPPPKVHSRTR